MKPPYLYYDYEKNWQNQNTPYRLQINSWYILLNSNQSQNPSNQLRHGQQSQDMNFVPQSIEKLEPIQVSVQSNINQFLPVKLNLIIFKKINQKN